MSRHDHPCADNAVPATFSAHEGCHPSRLTDDGLAFAIFFTKVHNRCCDRPQAPPALLAAMRTIDARLAEARLPSAAL